MLREIWADRDDRICANCARFAGAGAVPLVAPESDCIHAGTCAFLPDPAYLRRIAREADRPCDDYGVRPGRDCPGTLVPLPWICRGRNGRERRALS